MVVSDLVNFIYFYKLLKQIILAAMPLLREALIQNIQASSDQT